MKEIIIASYEADKLDFWMNVLEISGEYEPRGIIINEDITNNITNLHLSKDKQLVLIVSNNTKLSQSDREQLLLAIEHLAKEKKFLIINRVLAKQLSLSVSGLNHMGIRAIVDENMPILFISNIFGIVNGGGYYLEPLNN